MAHRNNEPARSDQAVADFYDQIAPDYDLMTGFEKRFVHEKPFFRMLVEKHNISSALDAGSGSGFHSILLAQLGVRVTAVDVSPAMLDKLAHHAEALTLHVDRVRCSFQEISSVVRSTFDAVFCLGNSLAHLLEPEELRAALANFVAALKPGGIVVLQLLNYDRIMLKRERIQSAKQSGDDIFVRFYDYGVDLLCFNILKLSRTGPATIEPVLNSTMLRPILRTDLARLLSALGLTDIKTFGGIAMEDFSPEQSKDLVILARKPDSR